MINYNGQAIEIKATKNGTDYVSVNFIDNKKRIGGFNAAIKTVKKLSQAGFFGAIGLDAVNNYIEEIGVDKIIEDMKNRAAKKSKDKFTL